jgi:protein TonB
MFDSVTVLARRRRHFGVPAAVSLVLHALAFVVIPAAATVVRVAQTHPSKDVFVIFNPRRAAPAAAPQAAAPAPKPATPKRKVPRRPVPPILLVPQPAATAAITAPPEPPPTEPPPAPTAPPQEQAARPDGILGGIGTAGASNARNAILSGPGGAIEYDDASMIPPERLSGPDPDYTYLARTYEVQGLMVVKCVVTTAGIVRDCRVVQGLPYMNEAVVDALLRRRYSPARLANGTAVDVDYTFRIRLKLVR